MVKRPRAESSKKFDYSPELFYSTLWKDLVRGYGLPFSFDGESLSFSVGSKETPAQYLAGRTSDVKLLWDYKQKKDGFAKVGMDPNEDLLAVMPEGELWALPALREWLQELSLDWTKSKKLLKDTRRVMLKTLAFTDAKNRFQGFTITNFGAQVETTGGIKLLVPGECACIRVNPNEYIRREHDLAQPAIYWTHNVGAADQSPQRVALYAGMGYLAQVAAQEMGLLSS